VLCTRRGLYTLGPTTLQVSDPFGIYTVTQKYPASTNLIVMPPIVPLPAIEVAPGGRSGEGRPRPNSPERTVSASGVREYAPGDSLHWVHWRSTAHRDELFVRLLDGNPAGDWWIALDLDASVQAGQDWDATEEHGIILAASLADRGLRLKRAVGLVSNCQPVIWLPPAEGDGRRWEILRSLALARPGATTLAELLARSQSAIGQRSSLILITPNVTGEWIPPLIQMLWRGVVPTVLLFDPVSFGKAPVEQASAQKAASLLAELGIAHYIFTRDMLDKPEARPGKAGGWEWRIAGRGRAVPVRKPGETPWKVLA